MADRFLRRTLTLGLATLVAVGIGLAAAQASSGTFRDNFDAVSFSGSNGSLAWSGAWIESGESDGAAAGRAQVAIDARCAAGGCGYLSAGGATTVALVRGADLSGASSATLTFSHRRTKVGSKAGLVRVSVSSNGGAAWSTRATYVLDTTDSASVNKSLNILAFATAETQIRFQVESTPGQSGRYHFDGVQISATFPDPTTTTTTTSTTTSTTTTTNPPTTTTTTTTTTTSAPTTTLPGGTTTTSQPPSTTTEPPTTVTTTTVVTTTPPPPSTAPPGPTSTPPGSTSTTLVAAPPVGSGGRSFPVFPIAALPRGTAAPLLQAAESPDPELSGLVRVASGSALIDAAQADLDRVANPSLVDAPPSVLSLAWPTLVAFTGLGLVSTIRRRRKPRVARG